MRRWSHLERQRGGVGLRGGPGEAQIELDRRMIGERIKSVKARLAKVKRQHDTQRKARAKSGALRVSLVGYTNAGKSTLFNALVKARAYAADQLFATLDTTTRSLYLEGVGAVGVAVRHGRLHPRPAAQAGRGLPRHAAGGHRRRPAAARGRRVEPARCEAQRDEVERVLAEIGAQDLPQILVYNKLDALEPQAASAARLDRRAATARWCRACSSAPPRAPGSIACAS